MRLLLNGNINRTYVQSLCMMFFHGEKFPEIDENPTKTLTINSRDTETGIECECILEVNGRVAESKGFAKFIEGEKYERTSKSAVGMAVYKAGVEITEKAIPWGILTGIRPSKVAFELISKYGDFEANNILKTRYFLSENKAELAVRVAKNEGEILKISNNILCGIMGIVSSVLRGLGYSLAPMIIAIVTICGIRITWRYLVFPTEMFNSLGGLYTCFPVSWIIATLCYLVLFVYAWRKIKKQKVIEIE